MATLIDALLTRTRTKLQNRQDLDPDIQQAIGDQLRELSTAINFPELEITRAAVVVVGPARSIPIPIATAGTDEVFAVVNITDITDAAARPLVQTSVRELDRTTILPGIPSRYVRYGIDILFDAEIPVLSTRTYQIRYRKYHDDPVVLGGSVLPSVWDEVIATGAALRIARDVLKDYDQADELEKQLNRHLAARGQLVEKEESKDADFGMMVVS